MSYREAGPKDAPAVLLLHGCPASSQQRLKAIIVQNAVAHEQVLGAAWDIRKAFWKDRAAYEDKVIPGFTSIEVAKRSWFDAASGGRNVTV